MTPSTQTATTTQVYRVYIRATAQAVWDAITRPEWTERYGYGGRADFELRPGGAYVHHTGEGMRSMGAPDVAVRGEVLECDPPRRLVQTWHMLMDPDIEAEGPSRLTYEIEEGKDGVTRLTLTHELTGTPRLAAIVSGQFEDQGAGGGWAWVLSGLKTVLETGTPLNR